MTEPTPKPLAVVTGASSGIGLELARQFATHGFDLIIAAEGGRLDDAERVLRGTGGARVEAVRADLGTYDGVEELCDRIKASGRPVEAIAINAGVGVGGDFARETRLEDELDLVHLNVESTVHLAKRIIPDMVARHSGHVLFTSSIAGSMPTPLEAVYGASKAFVLEFSASLHRELKDSGVGVTALVRGPTDTEFFRRAGLADAKVAEKAKENDPADVARMGFEALMRGDARIVAGNLEVKAQGAAARFVPEGIKSTMHERLARKPPPKGELAEEDDGKDPRYPR
jgi:short-subunit dehydrogenase